MGFDYDAIVQQRMADAELNRNFFIEELLKIQVVKNIVEGELDR